MSVNVPAFSPENRRFLSCHGQIKCKPRFQAVAEVPGPDKPIIKEYIRLAPGARLLRNHAAARLDMKNAIRTGIAGSWVAKLKNCGQNRTTMKKSRRRFLQLAGAAALSSRSRAA